VWVLLEEEPVLLGDGLLARRRVPRWQSSELICTLVDVREHDAEGEQHEQSEEDGDENQGSDL
jgi:hypothetical protein